jgi:hypothetical protein
MDEAFQKLVGKQDTVFRLGTDTFFRHEGTQTIFEYIREENQRIEYTFKGLEQLYSGDQEFDYQSTDWNDDRYLPLLMNIESAITAVYRTDPALKDKQVIAVLECLATKPEMSLANPLAVSIQDNLKLTLSLYNFSRREVLGTLKRVLKSVKRHHKLDGSRGYLDFVKDYI